MKIVLVGKNGQLGWEFQRILPILGEVISLDRKKLDLCDLDAIQKILSEWKPNLIINASAYTDVDGAEKETDLAMKINALAPGIMAEMSHKLRAVFIHYSTDYVFDGRKNASYTESDPTNPLNMYGKSKLAGEENIRQVADAYLILRTSWVYSLRGNSFVNKVLKWSRQNKTLKVVSDQISSPTWARTLAEITSFMLAQNKKDIFENIRERRGIYHLAGSGFTSRYDWAKQILANDPEPSGQIVQAIEPALSDEFPTPAVRPLFSALDCSRFEATFGLQLPGWNSTLQMAMTR
jgi:dTDP-4-dehydrorhamnose reductase